MTKCYCCCCCCCCDEIPPVVVVGVGIDNADGDEIDQHDEKTAAGDDDIAVGRYYS